MHARRSFVLAAAFALVASPALAAPKVPIGYTAYDSWNAIRGATFSPGGTWFAYALIPQDGDGTLVVRNVATGKEVREARGAAPVFTSDGRYVIYTIAPLKTDVDAAKKAAKKPDQQPKSGLGILDLSSGTAASIDRVKSRKLATHSAHWIAYLLEKPLPADASSKPSPSAAPSIAPTVAPVSSAKPTASPSPTPDNKKKAIGTKLVLRNLDSGATIEIADVTEYGISPDEKYLAYATETTSGTADGVHVRDIGGATATAVASGVGRYTKLAFAAEADALAFLSDARSYASDAPHADLMLWKPEAATASVVAQMGSAGLPRGYSPDADGAVGFTKDGTLLYFGTNVAPKPMPSDTPAPMQVDLWNWRDGRLQSEQQVEADADGKQTYLAVVHVAGGKVVQLGTQSLPLVEANDNHATALGNDPQPYYKQRSYDDFYQDSYLISLQSGRRTLAGHRLKEPCSLSPAGKYALCYDASGRSWYTVRASDGHRVVLTKGLKVAFYDELDDHPSAPPSYGSIGWTDGDARVLIHDRYDIWSFDPDRVEPRNLTAGYGRAHKLRFDREITDPTRDAIDPSAPLYLLALDDVTKDDGLFVLPNASGGTPKRLLGEPRQYLTFVKAKNADAFALQRGSFHEYPNYWIGDATFAHLSRVTDANPQMAKYRWGTEHLFHYVANGKHLDGIVYLPDDFNPKKKYPMLVYIYERFSDDLHAFHSPGPGTSPNLLRYVSNGYVVMVPDIAYGTGHPGEDALHAVGTAIDTIAKRGYVDSKHIGIAGHSWGAYEIAYMVTKTNRFAAVEAGAAVADMASAFGGIRWGSGLVRDFQYEHGQSRMGATPWDRPDLYLANSALFHVQDVHTPYLTIANDADDAVPWYQGIEFFSALRRLDKEAYLFVFNGEFHNLRGREQQKYWTVHLDEYFDHFLKGAPTPDWMLHGVPYLHKGERNVRPLYGEKP